MSTIRERAKAFRDSKGWAKPEVTDLVEFAEAERTMQRQEDKQKVLKAFYECDGKAGADGMQMYDGKWYFPVWGCDTLDHIMDSLTAGTTDSQNPFGCGCEWKLDRHFNRWVLSAEGVYSYSTFCNYCPKCGKTKRRET